MENQNNEQVQPSIVSLLGTDDEISIQFADGIKLIPPSIVGELGKDYFEQRVEAFRNINYGDFISGYTKLRQKQQLNQYQSDFMSSHFGQMY